MKPCTGPSEHDRGADQHGIGNETKPPRRTRASRRDRATGCRAATRCSRRRLARTTHPSNGKLLPSSTNAASSTAAISSARAPIRARGGAAASPAMSLTNRSGVTIALGIAELRDDRAVPLDRLVARDGLDAARPRPPFCRARRDRRSGRERFGRDGRLGAPMLRDQPIAHARRSHACGLWSSLRAAMSHSVSKPIERLFKFDEPMRRNASSTTSTFACTVIGTFAAARAGGGERTDT